MDLSLRKGKVVLSILLPIVWWVLLITSKIKASSGILGSFVGLHDITNLWSKHNLIVFVIEIVVLFIILSLFQRKRIPQR
jgi:hypothetical protein